ncbi:MAG TPA: NAD(P)/FAD-dependent oxidoreductase, partial [Solirubrobacteraceae bacterium]|nr:NAD(P)/FAD-dependent oxidoreductase [Solirubrobacteraceae bacterium]
MAADRDFTGASGAGRRRRLVIVGGGFGGLTAARELRGADVDVTLVDPKSHHLFQPLLYQLACGELSPAECASPIRAAVKQGPNVTVLMAKATAVDVQKRELTLDRGERLPYDSLLLACGAETSYFGNDSWQRVSYGLKTLQDAVDLRNRIYAAFEEAERTEDPDARRRWLTFVVIGGGPTGVELAGELAAVARETMKRYFRRIDPREARVVLLDAGDRLVSSFEQKLSAYILRSLERLSVTVHSRARVTAIDAGGVTFELDASEQRIEAQTVVWAAGVCAVPFAATVAQAAAVEHDRGGRIPIQDDLSLAGHPEISAIGDASHLLGPDGRPLPGLATVAIQQARHFAEGIRAGAPGASGPFRYFDKGALAVVGRGRAVCEIRGHSL